MGIIYSYINKINKKQYIGQTINPEDRQHAHKSNAFNEKNSEYNSPIHRAFRKYGYDNFEYQILAQTDDLDALNLLEEFFISKFDTQIPNGYNIEKGGKNCQKPPLDIEEREKLIWDQAKLTKDEVIELRKAYQNKESPKEIYEKKYKGRLHYQSFMNIWTGKRYSLIMPEVFQESRRTKLTEEIVRAIRQDRQNTQLSYEKLAKKYNISKATIADIVNLRTWKNVQ